MTKMSDLAARWLADDPAFRAEYEALEPEFQVIDELVRARKRASLTQAQVAERMGTTQSAVARLESGGRVPSIATLRRYAAATGARLRFVLEPIGRAPRPPRAPRLPSRGS
jgi:transcriptional regulator with XRE-family HTH domain